jgi:hypothetical protein
MKTLIFGIILTFSIPFTAFAMTIGTFKSYDRSGVGLVTADIDGDGDMDVLVATTRTKKIKLLKNNGAGVFSESYIGTFKSYDQSGIGLTAADMDGDGDIDVLVATARTREVKLIKNEGKW